MRVLRIDENPTLRAAWIAAAAGPEEGEHGVDAPVLAGVGGEVELAEDAADVRFDGLAGDEELLGDAAVGLALRRSARAPRARAG